MAGPGFEGEIVHGGPKAAAGALVVSPMAWSIASLAEGETARRQGGYHRKITRHIRLFAQPQPGGCSARSDFRPQHRGVEHGGRPGPEELGRATALARGRTAGGHQEAGSAGDLAMEVPRVENHSPHRLVHPPELADRELLRAERGGQGGVLDLGAGAFDPVGKDLSMVEGQRGLALSFLAEAPVRSEQVVDGRPSRAVRIAARGAGRSGARARWATLTTRIRGSRSGSP